jgi:hypothetical protein
MLQTVRASHPEIPRVCVTPITSALETHSEEYSKRSLHTREVMRDAAHDLMQAGDRNLYLLGGPDLLGLTITTGFQETASTRLITATFSWPADWHAR